MSTASDLSRLKEDGVPVARIFVAMNTLHPLVPVFAELRGLGMTDWLGRTFPFGELAPGADATRASEGVGPLWLACSVATDRGEGFDDAHRALREVLPVFALAVKTVTVRAVGQGLRESYLGTDAASRVMAGRVLRGEVHEGEAVLFYAAASNALDLMDLLAARRREAGQPTPKALGHPLLASQAFAEAAADSRGGVREETGSSLRRGRFYLPVPP